MKFLPLGNVTEGASPDKTRYLQTAKICLRPRPSLGGRSIFGLLAACKLACYHNSLFRRDSPRLHLSWRALFSRIYYAIQYYVKFDPFFLLSEKDNSNKINIQKQNLLKKNHRVDSPLYKTFLLL